MFICTWNHPGFDRLELNESQSCVFPIDFFYLIISVNHFLFINSSELKFGWFTWRISTLQLDFQVEEMIFEDRWELDEDLDEIRCHRWGKSTRKMFVSFENLCFRFYFQLVSKEKIRTIDEDVERKDRDVNNVVSNGMHPNFLCDSLKLTRRTSTRNSFERFHAEEKFCFWKNSRKRKGFYLISRICSSTRFE